MLILAVDTAGYACSVALCDDRDALAARHRPMRHGHAEALLPMVTETLAEADAAMSDVGLFAVTTGPGAFTGLRIGIAAVAGMALACGRPIVGIPSTIATAACLSPAVRRGHDLLIALDSRRSEPYLQLLDEDLRPLGPVWCGHAEGPALDRRRPLLLAGSAADRVLAQLHGRDVTLAECPAAPPAAVVAALARDRSAEAGPDAPLPIYVRPPDARPSPPGRGIAP